MTHARNPRSPEAVLAALLPDLTDAELAELGRSRELFRKCANPAHRQRLAFSDAAGLDRLLLYRGDQPRFLPLLRELVLEPAVSAEVSGAARRSRLVEALLAMSLAQGRLADYLSAPARADDRDLRRRLIDRLGIMIEEAQTAIALLEADR